jgi:hypothetical protein
VRQYLHSVELRRIAATLAQSGRVDDAHELIRAAGRLEEVESGVALDGAAIENDLPQRLHSRAAGIGDALLAMHSAALEELSDDDGVEDFADFMTLICLSAAASIAVSGARPEARIPSLPDFLASARERFVNAVIVDAWIEDALEQRETGDIETAVRVARLPGVDNPQLGGYGLAPEDPE